MSGRLRRALGWVVLTACLFGAFPPSARAQVLRVEALDGAQPIVEATLSGEPVRLIVALDAPAFLLVNASTAERAGLRATPLLSRGVSIQIRDEATLRGRTGRPRLSVGSAAGSRRRAIWIPDYEFTPLADGYVGLGALEAFDQIELIMDASAPETAATVLPGKRGLLEWRFEASSTLGAVDLGLSLIQRTHLDRRIFRQAEQTGLVDEPLPDAVDEPIGMFAMGQALLHPNHGLLIAGYFPQMLAYQLSNAELAMHEAQTGSGHAERIDVITITERSGANRVPRASLGRDVLRQCARLVFDLQDDSVTLWCPEGLHGDGPTE